MTDLELLFLVLGIIYVWECAFWARRGSVQVRTWWGKRWRLVAPSMWLGNQTGAIVLAQPLPPLGTLLCCNPWPLSISSEAVLAYVPPPVQTSKRSAQSGEFFRFEDIHTIEARGKKAVLNGALFLEAASPSLACRIVEKLKELQQVKRSGRGREIERLLKERFDTRAVEELWEDFRRSTTGLRFVCNLLFAYLFLIAPITIWLFGFGGTWPWLLAGMLGCTLTIATLFHLAHKRSYPSAEDERFSHFIIVLLSPASAVRACDLLARRLLESFHPLTVARVFCHRDEFSGLAREYLRELRYPALPLCPRPEPAALETEQYARSLALRALEKFLRQHQLQPEVLLEVPTANDSTSQAFCPRCLAQFTSPAGNCTDCGGVPLIRFPSAPAEARPRNVAESGRA